MENNYDELIYCSEIDDDGEADNDDDDDDNNDNDLITKTVVKGEELFIPLEKSLCGEIYRDFKTGKLSFRCTLCYIEVHLITEYSYHLDEHYLNQTKTIIDDAISIQPQIETIEVIDEFKNKNAYLLARNECTKTENNENIVSNPLFDHDATEEVAAVAKIVSVNKSIVKELENNKNDNCHEEKFEEFEECNVGKDDQVNTTNEISHLKIKRLNKNDPLKVGCYQKVCDYCYQIFSNKKLLRIHMRNKHITSAETEPEFYCQLCNTKFKCHHRFMIHKKQNSETIATNTTTTTNSTDKHCKECKLNFNSICSLRKHNRQNHPLKYIRKKKHKPKVVIPKGLICELCSMRFSSKLGLEYHMHSHSQNESSVKCQICEKTYSIKYMKIHMRTHSGEKPVQCQVCGECFMTKSKLSFHMRHHDGTLNRHKCTQCSAGYRHPNELRQHMNMHTGEKPYSCDQCQKSFPFLRYLQSHLRSHTGAKPYSCRYCTMTFSQASNRNQHEKQKHDIVTKHDQLLLS